MPHANPTWEQSAPELKRQIEQKLKEPADQTRIIALPAPVNAPAAPAGEPDTQDDHAGHGH